MLDYAEYTIDGDGYQGNGNGHNGYDKLDGDWLTYSIDYNRIGPDPLKLPRSGNTFRVGLSTDGSGVRYGKVRVKLFKLSKSTK